MNNNDECDIVKDLAILYKENFINSRSKKFVEEHLKTCNECQKYYSDINLNILRETKNEKIKEKHELDFLKKVRKKMNILKVSLICIIIIITAVMIGVFIKYQIVTRTINNSYNKIEYLKTLDNYKLTTKTLNINYTQNDTYEIATNYYYKNGKYKYNYDNTTCYYEDDSYNKIYVYNDLKQIDYYTQNFIENRKGSTFNIFNEIISYKNELPELFKLILSIRTERFNGIDCFVIRSGNKQSYTEVWIDKDTNLVLRRVEKEYLKLYRETTYTLVENEVTDEDVDSAILETEQYKEYTRNEVTNNATKEIKRIYGT